MKIDYSLGEPPQSAPLQKEQYTIGGETDEEISEGIYIEFDIPEKEKYWATRVYIEGLGAVAEEVQYTDANENRGCFFYPFVEAEKEYTIRFVFLRHEDKNEEGFVINYQGDDGIIGWFETKVKAGKDSKGEVRFTSKGKIDVKKNGEFRFTETPKFSNEHLLTVDDNKWSVDIGLVEGVSWEHGDERRTKWHNTSIPSDKLTETINLYRDQETEEYSIDFICVRPIMYYEHNGKTYKYQWESFVQDIYYPPMNPDFMHGIYLNFPIAQEEYSRCDVYIDEIGKVAEFSKEAIQSLSNNKNEASFFYPFVEPGKKYTIHFSFKKPEPVVEGFTLPTPGDDTVFEHTETVTVGAKSKGEVRLLSKGKAKMDGNGNFKFIEKLKFQNEDLLGEKWSVELGLIEGISWEHGDERRTKWHCSVQIPSKDFGKEINLYDYAKKNSKEICDIDCICIRPILLDYEYKGKKYSYQWDGFVHDVYYPPRNPDGIYLEVDLPKKEFSRCDIMIDGIGKVAEQLQPLNESKTKGCFFYPFVEANKEYTIRFSFKKPEPTDSAGFTLPTPGSDTLTEVTKTVTAGVRAKGEVRLPWENVGYLKADSDCNIIHFQKPTFENEELLGSNWLVEIGLMEGISWNHGDERRTKWHCAVVIPYTELTTISGNKNLRNLKVTPGSDPCDHEHDIDCLCVRPIMFYEYGGKEYMYMWDGYASDVHYPLNGSFQEIDINNPTDVAKIKGTWTQGGEWDETENFLSTVHAVYNETLVIDETNVSNSYLCTYKKTNGSAFTKQEIIDGFCYDELSNDLPDNYIDYEVGEFYYDWEFEWNPNPTMYTYKIYKLHSNTTLSKDGKTITDKDERTEPLSERFKNVNDYQYNYFRTYELKLSQDGSQLYIFHSYKDNNDYDEWTDIYYRQ